MCGKEGNPDAQCSNKYYNQPFEWHISCFKLFILLHWYREFNFTEESFLEIKEIVILISVGSSIISLILINWYMSIDYFILCVWHSIALPVFHQYFACISFSLFPEKCCAGQHFKVDLYSASGNPKQRDDARYSLTVVDIQCSSAKNGKFAIFIIPQGTASASGRWTNSSFLLLITETLGIS